MINPQIVEGVHSLLFLMILITPLFISRDNKKYSYYLYYWALFLIMSWSSNDGDCILIEKRNTDANKILLNNGPLVNSLNHLGIQTSRLANYIIRLILSLSTTGVLYYYSSRNNNQKLLAWCSSWLLFTIETLRYKHISEVGMNFPTFNNIMRTFKKENLNMFM
jgi:hypothetical protein